MINLRAKAQEWLGFMGGSKSMISSLGLHGLVLALILSSGYFKRASRVSQPPIDVDLLDIEFTNADQDLSQIKSLPKSLQKSQPIQSKVVTPVQAPNELAKDVIKAQAKSKPKSEISIAAKQELENLAQGQSSKTGVDNEGVSSKAVRMSYDQYLVSYINKYKTYPRIAERLKQQGVVISKIIISKDGQLKDVIINKSSGFSTLDQGTVNLIKSLAPFKPLPDNFKSEYEVSIPIEYILGS